MSIKEILDLANSGYPDGFLATMYDDEGKESTDAAKQGDTLALLIVRELIETHDAGASNEDQLATARRTLERAAADLQGVIEALTN